ncbi:hypothetical protein E2C01_080821 [Portunus trituberculatus]|uniref:Uncharacterized protein n=1 Tax=Portunus trituberculatus TaxID=210409 RepID=A0A5B7IV11_PORTR|nr:hypothetical protein [Portunus trituberculatus]
MKIEKCLNTLLKTHNSRVHRIDNALRPVGDALRPVPPRKKWPRCVTKARTAAAASLYVSVHPK